MAVHTIICLINRIRHRCLNIGTRIVTVRALTELDFVSFRYSPDRYDTRSIIQTTMYY